MIVDNAILNIIRDSHMSHLIIDDTNENFSFFHSLPQAVTRISCFSNDRKEMKEYTRKSVCAGPKSVNVVKFTLIGETLPYIRLKIRKLFRTNFANLRKLHLGFPSIKFSDGVLKKIRKNCPVLYSFRTKCELTMQQVDILNVEKIHFSATTWCPVDFEQLFFHDTIRHLSVHCPDFETSAFPSFRNRPSPLISLELRYTIYALDFKPRLPNLKKMKLECSPFPFASFTWPRGLKKFEYNPGILYDHPHEPGIPTIKGLRSLSLRAPLTEERLKKIRSLINLEELKTMSYSDSVSREIMALTHIQDLEIGVGLSCDPNIFAHHKFRKMTITIHKYCSTGVNGPFLTDTRLRRITILKLGARHRFNFRTYSQYVHNENIKCNLVLDTKDKQYRRRRLINLADQGPTFHAQTFSSQPLWFRYFVITLLLCWRRGSQRAFRRRSRSIRNTFSLLLIVRKLLPSIANPRWKMVLPISQFPHLHIDTFRS